MGEQLIRHDVTLDAQVRDGVGDVGRVPIHDRSNHQVEAGVTELLDIVGAVYDSALLEGEQRLRERVALLALVQAGLAALPEGTGFQPVEHEQRPLDSTQLLQRQIELVLPLVGSELLQHGGREHGSGAQRGHQASLEVEDGGDEDGPPSAQGIAR